MSLARLNFFFFFKATGGHPPRLHHKVATSSLQTHLDHNTGWEVEI